jgi:hypothetical protein
LISFLARIALMAGINDLASISEGNSIVIASINCMGYYIKGFFNRKAVSQKGSFANRKMKSYTLGLSNVVLLF